MKLRNPLGLISAKYRDPSICESCGEEFICGASLRGCWCTDIKLSESARQELRSEFKNCLCPNCLKKYEAKAD